MSFATGYLFDEERIAEAEDRVAKDGFNFSFSSDRPSLQQHWKDQQSRGIHVIAAQFDELQLNGEYRDPNHQSVGICVECGSERAIEDRHNTMIVDGQLIGVSTRIAGEVMYGYERKLRWGPTQPYGYTGQRNDGLMGSDAAAFYMEFGCIARNVYPGAGNRGETVDLSKQREELAIAWNNEGAPDVLVKAGAFHKIICHSSKSWSEYADAIAAKYWGWICLQAVFGMSRVIPGEFGDVLPDQVGPNAGHCTECCGVVTLPNRETGFLIQQSWGKNGPKYPREIQVMNCDGGSTTLALRPGSYCVRQSTLERLGNQVERISCDIPSSSSFRSLSA